jgi:hypothetical protein
MGDLVRRLRDRAEYNFGSCMCDLCAEQCVRCKDVAVQTEAADAIESLTARLAAAEEALRGNAAFIKAQAEERARVDAELTRAREAFLAAKAFIDSNIADPDLTDEMTLRYWEYRKHADEFAQENTDG